MSRNGCRISEARQQGGKTMAQHKFYVPDLKELDYMKLAKQTKRDINEELRTLFDKLLKKHKK